MTSASPRRPPKLDTLLSVEQAAERLGTSVRFVRRLIAERRIAYVKVGGREIDAGLVGEGALLVALVLVLGAPFFLRRDRDSVKPS